MGLTLGDRVMLDKELALLRQEARAANQSRREEILELESMFEDLGERVAAAVRRQGRVMALALIALSVAGASLLVQLARILAMGPSR